MDVFSIASEEKYAFVNFLKVMNGTIIQTQTIELKNDWMKAMRSCLPWLYPSSEAGITAIRKRSSFRLILIWMMTNIKFTVPKLGEKKKLLDLSQKNVQFFKKEKIDQYEKLNPEVRTERLLTQMMKDLRHEPVAAAYRMF